MMNKNRCKTLALARGEMSVYDWGGVRLHAYRTHDPIDDEVFLLEKDGQAVVIESPCFFDNNRELETYLAQRGLQVAGMLLAYHLAGGSFLPDARKYATANAVAYGTAGGGRVLIDGFAAAFGAAFDPSLHAVTDVIGGGPLTLGGMELVIVPTADAFDIEIPAIGAVYIHMLGHDCHSIVAGAAHADALIAQLQGYIDRGLRLILTSHHAPEDLDDAREKIDYLRRLKTLAAASPDAAAFKAAARAAYPDYAGLNYLDMTAGFFFG